VSASEPNRVNRTSARDASFSGGARNYADVIDSINARIAVVDHAGNILAVNRAWRKFGEELGVAAEKIGVGANYLSVCDTARGDEPEAALFGDGIRSVLSGCRPEFEAEYRCRIPGGDRWYLGHVQQFHEGGTARAAIQHFDITRVKNEHQFLLQEHVLWKNIIETSPPAIMVLDPEGRITFANSSAERIIGLSTDQLLQRRFNDSGWVVRDPDGRPVPDQEFVFVRVLRSHRAIFDVRRVTKLPDGSEKQLSISGAPIFGSDHQIRAVVISIDDLSSRIVGGDANRGRSAARSTHEQTMAIGPIAAGLAHEINNPVAAILLAAENALEFLDQPRSEDHTRRALRKILENGRRCGEILRDILRFASRSDSKKKAEQLQPVIDRALFRTYGFAQSRNTIIHSRVESPLPAVLMNAQEIEHVLVELIRDAVESAPWIDEVVVDAKGVREGVRISIADNHAAPFAARNRHFLSPFDTLRKPPPGSGLCLGLAHGIILDHSGSLVVKNRGVPGTTVILELPAVYE